MANTEVGSAYLSIVPSMSGFADDLSSGVTSAVSGLGSKLTSVLTDAVKEAVEAISTVVEAYANYEQLVGGVEKLFGDSADALQEYAQAAYQTAGLSANDYMEQVTSFSASLISSLDGDTAAAVEYANLAIEDMADNANTFGTSIEDIQNAYQGFAKQNYTMLDNLKLGYGGTKEEMERLIEDANELKEAQGEVGDLTIDSYADIVEAIHLVQEEMGITGTTANEAATTISGSISTAQAAWENWLVALADEELDIQSYTEMLLQSVDSVIENVAPRVAVILDTLGTALIEGIPNVINSLATAIASYAPTLLSAATSLFSSIGTAIVTYLPGALSLLINGLTEMTMAVINDGPEMLSSAGEFFNQIGTAIVDALPAIVYNLTTLAATLVSTLIQSAPEFYAGAASLLVELINGFDSMLPNLIANIANIMVNLISTVAANGPEMLTQGSELIWQLCTGIAQLVSDVAKAAVEVMADAIEYFLGLPDDALDWGVNIIQGLIDGIFDMADSVVETASGVADDIYNAICTFFGMNSPSTLMADAGNNVMLGLQNGMEAESGNTTATATSAMTSMASSVQTALNSLSSTMSSIMTTAMSTVSSLINTSTSTISSTWSTAWNGMSTAISSVWTGIQSATEASIGTLKTTVNSIKSSITSAFNGASSWLTSAGANIISGLVNSIKNGLSSVTSSIKSVCTSAISAAKKALGIASPSKVFAEVGEFTMQGMAEGITGTADTVQDALDESIGGLSVDTAITGAITATDVDATASSGPTAEEIADALLSALSESGLGVYLNGSTLVGELAPGMSKELGYLTMMGVA